MARNMFSSLRVAASHSSVMFVGGFSARAIVSPMSTSNVAASRLEIHSRATEIRFAVAVFVFVMMCLLSVGVVVV